MRSEVSRRQLLSLMFAGAGTAVLAACGGAASAPSPSATVGSSATVASRPPAEPKLGGTIRTGILGDLPGLDGHLQLQTNSQSVAFAYDTLVGYDDKLTPLPLLAESWDVASDLKTFKLNLRKGVQYHDGREFTSDDVKWNLLRVRDPRLAGVAGFFATQSNWFTGIDTPDKNTVVLTSEQPRVGAFDFFHAFNMLDKNTMEGPDARTKVNGTGPFVFQEWAQGDHVELTKNKNYWRSGVPYLDGIRVGIFKDSQAMMASLEAAAIDVADAPPIPDIVRLKSNPSYQTIVTTSGGTYEGVSSAQAQSMSGRNLRMKLLGGVRHQPATSPRLPQSHGILRPAGSASSDSRHRMKSVRSSIRVCTRDRSKAELFRDLAWL
jgi:peptide/nickel transport system substrate-binding protein